MASTNFADGVTLTDDEWFNDLNTLHYVIFGDPVSLPEAHSAFFSLTVGAGAIFSGSFDVKGIASLSAIGGSVVATQAQMETGSAVNVAATPGRIHFHPGVAKMWVNFDGSATSVTAALGYNISAISDDGAGVYVVEFSTSFSSETGYAPIVSSNLPHTRTRSQSAGRVTVLTNDFSDTAADASQITFAAFGDFA